MDKNLYYPLWQKYLPVIEVQMKNATKGVKEIQLDKSEFEKFGNRKLSNYIFNLEIDDGKVINDISGTAVARDFFDVLKQNPQTLSLMLHHHYKFSMGRDFKLRIILNQSL